MGQGNGRSPAHETLDRAARDRLADAVEVLDPQPRERRWVSLSLCILDAVWSIGANYDNVVVPLTRNLAKEFGVDRPVVPMTDALDVDPLPVTRLGELGVEELARRTNRQRTSTRGGILKADAVLRHINEFVKHDVTTLRDGIDLLADSDRFAAVDKDLRSIPGEGARGVRRNYLWMLIGQDDLIKPDRMVLRWFRHHGVIVDPADARDIITALVPIVSQRLRRDVTAWEIDHALWLAGRGM
ncbi:hypothetical protein CRI77_16265 [Mycolicibacterium duvalii]|nr:hypothetical protein [Mycolicibacterium duvalii]PEG39468.1 hypothetical protein CRI77_16265 [Mycolicibacterium duvalii]